MRVNQEDKKTHDLTQFFDLDRVRKKESNLSLLFGDTSFCKPKNARKESSKRNNSDLFSLISDREIEDIRKQIWKNINMSKK